MGHEFIDAPGAAGDLIGDKANACGKVLDEVGFNAGRGAGLDCIS